MNKLFKLDKEKYLLKHSELKNTSSDVQDKRYEHYNKRRKEQKKKYMTNEKIANFEVKIFNESEKNRRIQINNFKNSMNREGNLVFKFFSIKYECYSNDMKILGKKFLQNFPEFEYLIDNNIK